MPFGPVLAILAFWIICALPASALEPAGPEPRATGSGQDGPVRIALASEHPAMVWAAAELAAAVRATGCESAVLIHGRKLEPSGPPAMPASSAASAPGSFQVTFGEAGLAGPGAPRPLAPESYTLEPHRSGLFGHYGDEVGAMYALLELAERVQLRGVDALRLAQTEEHAPAVAFRAVNPFLSIPLADAQGARDWEHWWFTDEEFWRGYLDLLARSRFNWIDLHGMYDIQSTRFPNMWPYFVASATYPDVGVAPEQARRNLAMLEQVCQMARQRGIRLALMNYTGGWNWPGCRPAPERPVEDFIAYTKEGLTQIVQGCPSLGMIGFRIGESGYGEDFYARSYVAALEELGRPLPLYTRTWGAKKDKLLELGRLYPDKFLIEIKYNGEQLGPAWHVAGGRMSGWRDYSYQDYLFYPRAYKVAWQIRANGTHRVFQWAAYERIRACVRTTNLADSIGFCVEPMSTYYPLTDFFHKTPLFRWEYERNPLWYLLWGRLAYDPETPESVFRLAARAHWGREHGDAAYELLQSLSRIVPTLKTQYSLGPDHRDHAPELEWGGSIRQWARGAPFDTFAAMSPMDYAREAVSGDHTGRRSPLRAAALLERYAAESEERAATLPAGVSPRLDDLKLDAQMLAALARYHAARLRAAASFALAEWTGNPEVRLPDHPQASLKSLVEGSQTRWRELADLGDRHYRPFLDTLRMHTEAYVWSQVTPNFQRDAVDLATMSVSDVPVAETSTAPPGDGGELTLRVWPGAIDVRKDRQILAIRATIGGLASDDELRRVTLYWKPFRSESSWQRIPMQPVTGQTGAVVAAPSEWVAQVEVDSTGALYGLEVVTARNATIARVDGLRPYGVINPWPVR